MFYLYIESLHDAVRTNAQMILQHLLVSFFAARYGGEQQKTLELLINLWKDLNFQPCVCVCAGIFVTCCNLIIWYELNKRLWAILLLFPIPHVSAYHVMQTLCKKLKHIPNTIPCEQETNLTVASMMTCKICLI